MELLDKDFNCLKYAQRAEGNHKQRTKGNQETGVRVRNMKKEIEITKRNQIVILELKVQYLNELKIHEGMK